MLQVARLAPPQLGESRDLVAGFLHARVNPDGGFQNRAGASDLYYTVFGLDALIGLQEPLPAVTADYVDAFADSDLDFVHLACLARAWAALKRVPAPAVVDRLLARLETFRTSNGGYATSSGASHGTAYAAFLALGAYQDLGRTMPPDGIAESLQTLKAVDGSYANHPGMPTGLTTATAAAVLVLRHIDDAARDRNAGVWLLDRCHPRGGFFASPATPVPDLLSTATALHALSTLHLPLGGLREPCLDFVDSLWTNRGGFFGTWADDDADCEYTFYALLALGHLSLAS